MARFEPTTILNPRSGSMSYAHKMDQSILTLFLKPQIVLRGTLRVSTYKKMMGFPSFSLRSCYLKKYLYTKSVKATLKHVTVVHIFLSLLFVGGWMGWWKSVQNIACFPPTPKSSQVPCSLKGNLYHMCRINAKPKCRNYQNYTLLRGLLGSS